MLLAKVICRSNNKFYIIKSGSFSDENSKLTIESQENFQKEELKQISQKEELKQIDEEQNIRAVTTIQKAYRRHKTQILKTLGAEEEQRQIKEKSLAAIKIQSTWKGHLGRVKVKQLQNRLLSFSLFEKAKVYIDSPSKLENLPRAYYGKKPVYLPHELPIVLKQSGSPANVKRSKQMNVADQIIKKKGYTRLEVPKTRVYLNFIIESKLPIRREETKAAIGFYIENREKFTQAVKEFAGFLCQARIGDITGGNKDPYDTLSESPLGRYDNVAMYLEEEQGKIGLIDLEGLYDNLSLEIGSRYFACEDAIHLFPYHLDEILEAAKEFDPEIESDRKRLEKERDEALKRFKIAYEDHIQFVKEKGITLDNPTQIVEISSERQENIEEAVVLMIKKENSNSVYKNFLVTKPEDVVTLFKESFPKILNLITTYLFDKLKEQVDNEKVTTYRELVCCRTLLVDSDYECFTNLKKQMSLALEKIQFKKKWSQSSFISLIIQAIFEDMAKGKEIAYYNPSFGCGGFATQCIFC